MIPKKTGAAAIWSTQRKFTLKKLKAVLKILDFSDNLSFPWRKRILSC